MRFYENDNGCWIWDMAIHHSGYGIKTHESKTWFAHRYMWAIIEGRDLPAEAYLCHKCNVKACVNPEHLYVGDALTNAADFHATPEATRLEKHPRARLTEADVRNIRRRDGINYNAVAREYGVDSKTIWNAYNYRTWRGVSP